MYLLFFFFVAKFFQYNNLLYKLFLFLYYWYSTKYCKASCFQIFTLSCHITINKFHSQWEPHNSFILEVLWTFINNFACCFFSCLLYFTMKDESVRFFLCTSVRYLSFSMLNQLQHLIGCPSDILGTCFDFFDNLKVYKRILLKEKHFSHVIMVLLGSS